jgi:hypothetical protein
MFRRETVTLIFRQGTAEIGDEVADAFHLLDADADSHDVVRQLECGPAHPPCPTNPSHAAAKPAILWG